MMMLYPSESSSNEIRNMIIMMMCFEKKNNDTLSNSPSKKISLLSIQVFVKLLVFVQKMEERKEKQVLFGELYHSQKTCPNLLFKEAGLFSSNLPRFFIGQIHWANIFTRFDRPHSK